MTHGFGARDHDCTVNDEDFPTGWCGVCGKMNEWSSRPGDRTGHHATHVHRALSTHTARDYNAHEAQVKASGVGAGSAPKLPIQCKPTQTEYGVETEQQINNGYGAQQILTAFERRPSSAG